MPEAIRWGRRAAPLTAIAVAAGLLMAPALWNGSVFFYWDSVDYVYLPFTGKLPMYRTMPYGVFTGIGRLAGSLWAVAAAQALLVAYVLHEALAAFAPRPAWRLLVPLTLLLSVLTALPWGAGQIMPDVFTGIAILGVATLTFERGRLNGLRRGGLVAVTAVAIAMHTTHIAVAAGLVVALAGLGWLLRLRWQDLKPRVGLAAASVAMGISLVAGIHWVTVGRPFVTQPAAMLMLARLVQDGIAKRFLDDHCPEGSPYRLCRFRASLPKTANSFLWEGNTIPNRLGGWKAMEGEATEIITESLEEYPLLHVETAARLTAEQALMFRTGDGIVRDVGWLINDTLRRYYPDDYRDFKESEQNAGIDFKAVNRVHVTVQAAAQILLLGILVVAWRRRDRLAFGLAVAVLLTLLGNAFVCGALSNPNDRYQNRIVWLAVVVVTVAAVRLRRPDGISAPQSHAPGVLTGMPRYRPIGATEKTDLALNLPASHPGGFQ
ncbi:MAG: hypothetical protein IH626_16365 [Rhodospirillales bacterium]|nr:hypothetical protein [Rhodospirillales bacterium]